MFRPKIKTVSALGPTFKLPSPCQSGGTHIPFKLPEPAMSPESWASEKTRIGSTTEASLSWRPDLEEVLLDAL